MTENGTGNGLLEIGGKFGAYDVLRLLGRGGMGEVYLLRSPSDGEFYACKIMYPPKSGSGEREVYEWRRRFANEAMFAMKVTHRNLIRVYDAGEDPDTHLCYIIMDYMSGGNLSSRLRAKGRLEVSDAVKIVIKVATALEAAHRAGIVHRDIKPDNIMFDDDGEPRLADLGIAKFSTGDTSTTSTNIIIGTPSYMAPEQMMDSHGVDARADVYSLGVVLYEMLTGSCPHEDSGAMERMARALNGEELKNVCEVRPDVPASVGYVLAKMTANKAEKRPGSALEAARMLCDAMTGKLKVPRSFRMNTAVVTAILNGKAMARAAMVLSAAVLAVVIAFVFVRIFAPGGGGGEVAVGEAQMAVQTNQVNMTRYNVVVVTNEIGEIVATPNPSAVIDDDEPFGEIVVESEPDVQAVAMDAGKSASPSETADAQSAGDDDEMTLKVVVDGEKRKKYTFADVRYESGAIFADLEPLPEDGAVADDAAAPARGEPDKQEESARVEDAAQGRKRYPAEIREVKIANVPNEFRGDLARRQYEHSSRDAEWGANGCIVFGRLELEDSDGVDGVSTWAWLKSDGRFTATMHPGTSNGEIVFLRHGYERLVVHVPAAMETWKSGVAYNLGTLTMKRLPSAETGGISFRLHLPKDVKRAVAKVELAGDYPLGFNRTERPFMKRTIVSKKMIDGDRLELTGCARDRYVVTIDAPGCQLFSRAYVLAADAARGNDDTLVKDGKEEIGEISLTHNRKAKLSVRGRLSGKWLQKEILVDNRGEFAIYGGVTVRLTTVDGERYALKMTHGAVGDGLYDYGKIPLRQFKELETGLQPLVATKSEDSIVRPGHVYRYNNAEFPEGYVVFCLDKY